MTTPPCRRCGTCCAKGGPALHLEDLHLVKCGLLGWSDLVTLRAGEPAFDQVAGEVWPLAAEIVKLAGKPGSWACRFHDAQLRSCLIHEERPAECRALSCRDTRALAAMYAEGRITRAHVVPPGSALAELAREHDTLCSAHEAARLAQTISAGTAGAAAHERLGELVRLDRTIREVFLERTTSAPDVLPFLFGRPLPEVLAPYGLQLP